MWLINVNTKKLEKFSEECAPPYAILSHTWKREEVSFHDLSLSDISLKKPEGYAKIEQTCRLSQGNNLEYAWVDTCCIDKSNNTEYAEAINSMFRWYKKSTVCYAYLSDLDPTVSTEDGMPGCRWFTRGWTLQELIAPSIVMFYDACWTKRGSKNRLASLISSVTRIDEKVLCGKECLSTVSVAAKMSWASNRETTVTEDTAYCLLGIFDINLTVLYGEGPKAFIRLQEAIAEGTDDMSIFAWEPLNDDKTNRGIFARSPAEFHRCGDIFDTSIIVENDGYKFTSKGLQITTQLIEYPQHNGERTSSTLPHFRYVLDLNCTSLTKGFVGIFVRKYGPRFFLRDLSRGSLCLDDEIRRFKRLPEDIIHIPRDISDPINRIRENWRCIGIHLKVMDGLKIIEAVPAELWDPSLTVFLPPLRSAPPMFVQ
jgi:hypothetical protein